jgi:Fe-S oxidoreductase
MCRYRSPGFIATKLESVTPHGHGILLSEIDSGKRKWSAEIVDKIYQSPMGGECRQDCAYHWPEDEMTRHARAEIVTMQWAPQVVRGIAESILTYGTPFGARNGWARSHGGSSGGKGAEVLFLCGDAVEHLQPGILNAVSGLLDLFGVRWAAMENESPSGATLFDLGYVEEARQAASRLADQIAGRKPTTIVTTCPHTLRALREFFPQWGVELPRGIELFHTSEFFLRFLKEQAAGDFAGLGVDRIAYHDCAELGRTLGVFQPPREILSRITGKAPIEFHRCREKSGSSGAGSSMFLTHPQLSVRIALKTLEGIPEPGADLLVTGCPTCKTTFQRALEGIQSKTEVLDISELLAGALLPQMRRPTRASKGGKSQ